MSDFDTFAAAIAAITEPTARAVLDLHACDSAWDCAGCDYSGWESEPPSWPCRTVLLIAEIHGVRP